MEKKEVDRLKKELSKRKPVAQSTPGTGKRSTAPPVVATIIATSNSNDGFLRPDFPKELSPQEYYEQEEILRIRLQQIKKEEMENISELERLEQERNLHIRELKRVQNEDQSK